MNKWAVVLAVGLLGGCASSEQAIHLVSSSGQQVKCGPFATKTPLKRYLEAQYGAPGAAERLGDTASTQLHDCVEEYQRQGYALLGAPSVSAPPPALVARDLAKPIYEAALATEQGDAARALRNMHELADQGDTRAQTVLGKAYKDGLGVPQDYVQAHMWYNLAAASAGSSSAERELRDIAFNERQIIAQLMSREQISEAQKLARAWRPSQEN
jgi:hypothetical protein